MMNSNQLVSVIIPTFNRAKFIVETINSVLKQTYTNLEIIIVDDGSIDETGKIVKAIKDQRIKYIYTKNWGGPARPRNIGLGVTKGEYITFLDDDDLWAPNKVESQIKCFQENSNIGLVYTDMIEFNEHKRRYISMRDKHQSDPYYFFVHSEFSLPISSVMIKSSFLNSRTIFPEKKKLIAIEDYCLLVELSKMMQFKKCCETYILYRMSNDYNKISRTKDRKDQLIRYTRSKNAFKYLLVKKVITEQDYYTMIFRLNMSFKLNIRIDYKNSVRKNDEEYIKSKSKVPFIKKLSVIYNVLVVKILRSNLLAKQVRVD